MYTSRWWSILEVGTNTFTGLFGSWLITLYCITNIPTALQAATMATVVCTVWSLLRGYVIRRSFNWLIERYGYTEI